MVLCLWSTHVMEQRDMGVLKSQGRVGNHDKGICGNFKLEKREKKIQKTQTKQHLRSIGSLQKYNVGSFEFLSKAAPFQALSLIVFGPFIDYYLNVHSLLTYKMSTGALLFILLSCSLAVLCNISQYLCIGCLSAVSFQVLGQIT